MTRDDSEPTSSDPSGLNDSTRADAVARASKDALVYETPDSIRRNKRMQEGGLLLFFVVFQVALNRILE
jgi:hypothetical protein